MCLCSVVLVGGIGGHHDGLNGDLDNGLGIGLDGDLDVGFDGGLNVDLSVDCYFCLNGLCWS